jgi:hypothetical protein
MLAARDPILENGQGDDKQRKNSQECGGRLGLRIQPSSLGGTNGRKGITPGPLQRSPLHASGRSRRKWWSAVRKRNRKKERTELSCSIPSTSMEIRPAFRVGQAIGVIRFVGHDLSRVLRSRHPFVRASN